MRQVCVLACSVVVAGAATCGCGGADQQDQRAARGAETRATSATNRQTTETTAQQETGSKGRVREPRSPAEHWMNDMCKSIEAWILGFFRVNAGLPGTTLGESPASVWRSYTQGMRRIVAIDAEFLTAVEAAPPAPVPNGGAIRAELAEHVRKAAEKHAKTDSRWRSLPRARWGVLYRRLDPATGIGEPAWDDVDAMRAWLVRWVKRGGMENASPELAAAAGRVPACRQFYG